MMTSGFGSTFEDGWWFLQRSQRTKFAVFTNTTPIYSIKRAHGYYVLCLVVVSFSIISWYPIHPRKHDNFSLPCYCEEIIGFPSQRSSYAYSYHDAIVQYKWITGVSTLLRNDFVTQLASKSSFIRRERYQVSKPANQLSCGGSYINLQSRCKCHHIF